MSAPYPVELYPGCPCYSCDSKTWPAYPNRRGGTYRLPARMSVCPRCGSKRCDGAVDHRRDCTTAVVEDTAVTTRKGQR